MLIFSVELTNAIGHEGASPIVRVPSAEEWMIKRALDAGAHGILTPMCHSEVSTKGMAKWRHERMILMWISRPMLLELSSMRDTLLSVLEATAQCLLITPFPT